MHIDEIQNGIVLDHITAGKAMEIYHFLELDGRDCPVAILQNVGSRKMGRKDIIKIDAPIDTLPIFLRDGKQDYLIGRI